MKSKIKKLIPQPIKDILRPLKKKFYDDAKKRLLFLQMQKKHQQLIEQIKGKKKIKVVFLAIHKSVWKVDPVFKKMMDDSYFEPLILVCPYTAYGEERMWGDMKDTYEYFEDKGYPLLSSYNKDEDRWISLEEIKPDIVFFTNPHDLTRKEYYKDAYMNYLSCYVPYHHEVGSFGDNDSQHNQLFHNMIWNIFSAHQDSYILAKSVALNKASNISVTGFPAMENLIKMKVNKNFKDVWKTKDERKRVIWSPHHLINEEVNQSNFLEYADFFKEIAEKYESKVVWAFKPHPILKSKLYLHPEWGKERTDEYYQFWQNSKFTQLELGEYEELFLSSDSMIHDCGSFLAEYIYVEKPVMYLLNNKHNGQFFNSFGKAALNSCRIGKTHENIVYFLENLISETILLTEEHEIFLRNNVKPFFENITPSDLIINTLKDKLKNED